MDWNRIGVKQNRHRRRRVGSGRRLADALGPVAGRAMGLVASLPGRLWRFLMGCGGPDGTCYYCGDADDSCTVYRQFAGDVTSIQICRKCHMIWHTPLMLVPLAACIWIYFRL